MFISAKSNTFTGVLIWFETARYFLDELPTAHIVRNVETLAAMLDCHTDEIADHTWTVMTHGQELDEGQLETVRSCHEAVGIVLAEYLGRTGRAAQ